MTDKGYLNNLSARIKSGGYLGMELGALVKAYGPFSFRVQRFARLIMLEGQPND